MNKRKYMKQSCHHPRHSLDAGIKVIRNYKRSFVCGDGWGWRQQCVTRSSLKLCAYVIKYSGSIKIRAIRLEIQLKVIFSPCLNRGRRVWGLEVDEKNVQWLVELIELLF